MKKLETKLVKINYSDSLQDLADKTVELLQSKIKEYSDFFEIEINDKIIVNYFDNIEEFREFIYEIRGEKKSLPEYAKGTYDKGMVNAFIKKENQLERLYTSSHELFHILYMKYILKNTYSNRITWYDEGMAQFMSGEKDKLNKDNEALKKFYLKVKKDTKVIPRLNDLVHGDSFINNEYNGYNISYLSVKYLSEKLKYSDFKKLMSDFSSIKKYGENISVEMFNYYDKKYF